MQRYTASFASNSEAKALCAMTASQCEAKFCGEAILASPPTKQRAFKAKPRVSQPKRAYIQSPRVFVLDRLGPANTDLRENLSNK